MKKVIWLLLLLGLFVPAFGVFAKGEFDYLLVKGPGIADELDITDPSLTRNFFAFADFSKGSITVPADPGQGYQIFRIYVVDGKDQPFDQLHYYPYTGYVYYDGLINGSSEYDGKWYSADPAADAPFRGALGKSAKLTWITFVVVTVFLVGFYIAYRSKPAAINK